MRRSVAPALSLILAAVLAAAASGAPESDNLVDNPSFDKKGEDPVPGFHVRRITGLTSFRAEGGVLRAERRSGSSGTADSCVQTLYVPKGAEAIRVSLRARADRVAGARLILRFKDSWGQPTSKAVPFAFRGTHPFRKLERDLPLPPGSGDLDIAFEMTAPGLLLVDDVSVTVIKRGEIRAVARAAVLTATVPVRGSDLDEHSRLLLPIPPVTGTQVPLSLAVRTRPADRVRRLRFDPEAPGAGVRAYLTPPGPGAELELTASVRVLLTEGEDAPDSLPLAPSKRLPRDVRRLAALPEGAEPPPDWAGQAGDAKDLLDLAGRVVRFLARKRTEDGALAADLFRTADVPARAATLVPIAPSGVARSGVLAYQRDHGWIRFGLREKDPRPLPAGADVMLPADVVPGGSSLRAEEAAGVTLPDGAGPDLVRGLATSWGSVARRLEATGGGIAPEEVKLRGKAKKLAERLAEILGAE